MNILMHIRAQLTRKGRGFLCDQTGGVLVEFAVVVSLFLFLFLSLLDFGRLSYSVVSAQKAAQLAARIAVVRPPACNYGAGVFPDTHNRGPSSLAPRFGTSCSAGTGVCIDPNLTPCSGAATNTTAAEIWGRVSPLLPPDATIDNLRFHYDFNDNLGFLGGPFTPMVTVELDLADFNFVSPLAALANAAGATNSTLPQAVGYSNFSVSLPAEDLALGESG
ncbi:Flp pilus assembly protein TadG [Ruegeria denitrificans]|uniref:Flp pilus assembly protein TadG n=1 Tax=Ruegeria denitrificans TaxID=1715692 RepID=A0A0N7M9F3_9RHOB|nr:TadE/TadG family type IV pilus assembly protein [Ruegeria denitrificans]CUJ98736.1 Flp pilus assembly protein TadG [Ruegeria denitrificans]